jgi:hypothetical protein
MLGTTAADAPTVHERGTVSTRRYVPDRGAAVVLHE